MAEIIIATTAHPVDSDKQLVGVYTTFDKAVHGCDAHRDWFGHCVEYWLQACSLDSNNTQDCLRYRPFQMVAGNIPHYYLRGSEFDERFQIGEDT